MKNILQIILLFVLLNQAFSLLKYQKLRVPQCSAGHETYEDINNIQKQSGYIPFLQYNNFQGIEDPKTQVTMCHRQRQYLDVTFYVPGNNFESQYQSCNDPLFQDNSVGIILATKENYMNEYLEVLLNTQGAMWGAIVHTKNQNSSDFNLEMLQCRKSGIFYSSQNNEGFYAINVEIPIQIITGTTNNVNSLNFNVFKISKNQSQFTLSSFVPTYSSKNTNETQFDLQSTFAELIFTNEQVDIQ